MHRTYSAFLSVSIAVLFGCGDRPDRSGDPAEAEVAVEGISLGSLEEGPAAFGRVAGLVEDSGGRILVADHQASEIRVFAPDGRHLFSFGGRGAGPGELAGPCCLAWAPDGSLWVRETENQRYSGFEVGDSSAAFRTTMQMNHTDGSYAAPLTFTSNGALIDVGRRVDATGAQELVRFVRGADGSVADMGRLPRTPVEELGGFTVTRPGIAMYFYQPYAARELIAHGPGGRWAHGLSSTYEITLHDGDTSRVIVGSAARPALSDEERVAAQERLESDARRAGIAVRQLPYGVPDRKPPLQAIFFDEEGTLWVELSRADGEPRAAELWNGEGELIRRVQWPGDIAIATPGWVGSNSALGIRRDSLGVEHVVRLSF